MVAEHSLILRNSWFDMSDGLFYQVMMKSGTSLENCHVGKDEKPKTKMPLIATIPYYSLLQVTRYHLLVLVWPIYFEKLFIGRVIHNWSIYENQHLKFLFDIITGVEANPYTNVPTPYFLYLTGTHCNLPYFNNTV